MKTNKPFAALSCRDDGLYPSDSIFVSKSSDISMDVCESSDGLPRKSLAVVVGSSVWTDKKQGINVHSK